jgi:hypothetical protein
MPVTSLALQNGRRLDGSGPWHAAMLLPARLPGFDVLTAPVPIIASRLSRAGEAFPLKESAETFD